jgi:hypothetical protein
VLLKAAKKGFPVLREDVVDRFSHPALDELVGVDKLKVELAGDLLADAGLARAHKADENEIFHEDEFTPQISGAHAKIWAARRA